MNGVLLKFKIIMKDGGVKKNKNLHHKIDRILKLLTIPKIIEGGIIVFEYL